MTTPTQFALVDLTALRTLLAEAQPESKPALLDRAGLARELGVSASTVDRLRAEGMPCIMVGESPRFQLRGVLTWFRVREATRRVREGRASQWTPGFVAAEVANDG